MADDFQVRQGQSSAGAYGLTGGVIGAAAGGLGAHYITKPKYSSHDDIINEAKDSADFKSKIENASGEEKNFLQAAKDVADEKANAEKVWNDEFKAYQETHKDGVKETDEYKKLIDAKNEAEKAFNDKKAELEKVEIPAKEGTADGKTKKSIDKVKKMIEEEKKSIETYNKSMNTEMKNATKDLYEAASNMTDLDTQINNLRTEKAKLEAVKRRTLSPTELLVDPELNELNAAIDETRKIRKETKAAYDKGLAELEKEIEAGIRKEMSFPKGKEGEKQVKAKVAEIKAYLLDTIQERTLADAEVKVDVAKIAESKEKAIKDLKELTKGKKGYAGVDLAGKSTEEINKEVGRHIDVQKKQLEKIESFKELYKQAAEKAKASGGKTTTVEEFKMMLGSWETPVTIKKTVTTGGEESKKFVDTLTKEELATFNRLVEGGDEAAIDKAIKTRKDKITALEKGLNEIKTANARITELGGEGAYVKHGILYNADGEKVEIKPKEVKIAEEVKAPKTSKLRSLEEQLAKLEEKTGAAPARKYTETEIKEKLAEEAKKLEEAKKAVEDAKKGLEKVELTPEQQLADFAKEKGVKDKNEFVNNKIKEKTDKFAKDFESQFKRKHGFAEHANWKIAGVAAAGALILGGIASALAPKDRA